MSNDKRRTWRKVALSAVVVALGVLGLVALRNGSATGDAATNPHGFCTGGWSHLPQSVPCYGKGKRNGWERHSWTVASATVPSVATMTTDQTSWRADGSTIEIRSDWTCDAAWHCTLTDQTVTEWHPARVHGAGHRSS